MAYDASGKLIAPAEGQAAASRVAPTADEQSLSGLAADAYKVDVPERPVLEVPGDDAGDNQAPEDGDAGNDADSGGDDDKPEDTDGN